MGEFLSAIISSTTATPMKVPPGLSSTSAELARLGGQLLRLVCHNRAVFGAYYTEILEGALPRLDSSRAARDGQGEGSGEAEAAAASGSGAAD